MRSAGRRSLAVLVAVILLVGLVPAQVLGSSEVLDVGEDFDLESIAEAIEEAEEGDTILVHPGVYRETVVIDKDGITLQSAEPLGVDLEGGIIIQADGVTVEGFFIFCPDEEDFEPVGINVSENTEGHVIRNNWLWTKGQEEGTIGILLGSGTKDALISGNVIEGWETGIFIDRTLDAEITVTRNHIYENGTGIGGNRYRGVHVTYNTLEDNGEGVGYSGYSSGPVLRYNNISGNDIGLQRHDIGVRIDAALNWWGARTGPENDNNPDGRGDQVLGRVKFTPWLTSPVHAGYTLEIDGPTKGEVDEELEFEVTARGDGQGTESYTAIYDYEISGGEGELSYYDEDGKKWRTLPLEGSFGPADGFELTPDWDVTTLLLFVPEEEGTFEVKVVLRTVDDEDHILAEASHTIEVVEELDEDEEDEDEDEETRETGRGFVRVLPRTFNLRSQGVLTIRIQAPGLTAGDFDKIKINGEDVSPAVKGPGGMLLLKIDRTQVGDILSSESGPTKITVKIGSYVIGSDTINVINPGQARNSAGGPPMIPPGQQKK